MTQKDFSDFSKQVGLEIVTSVEEEHAVRADNPILNQINLARIRGEDLRVHYNRSAMDIEWFHFEFVERAYRKYKEKHLLLDFTDLLERIIDAPERLPTLEVLIVDEAQDMSQLQWRLVLELASRAKRSYIAGDDDQAVYNWAGADHPAYTPLQIRLLIEFKKGRRRHGRREKKKVMWPTIMILRRWTLPLASG